MMFYQGKQFPPEYQGDIFASEHGSWNRSVRVGYEVIRVPRHHSDRASGEYEDFLTGFVVDNGHVWGRPVGVAEAKDGSLLVTDDGSNSIWRIVYTGGIATSGEGDSGHKQEGAIRRWHCSSDHDQLNAVIYAAKRVLVGFARVCGFRVRIVLGEMSVIPTLHCHHGMVRSRQRFFKTNGVNPFIDSFLIGKTQLIKILFAHTQRSVLPRIRPVNRKGRN